MCGGGFAYSGRITFKGALGFFAVVFALFLLGLILARPQAVQAQINIQQRIAEVETLTKGDLIVFPNNRYYFVRDNNRSSLKVVQWVGNGIQEINIESFVRGSHGFKLVRKTDPKRLMYMDSFLNQ